MHRFAGISMLAVGILLVCAATVFALVDPRGSDETHDFATWNCENFPLSGNLTVNYLTLLIRDLELDMIAMQEINSIDDFDQLVSNLAGWDGIYSPDTYGGFYVKTGILWNTETVTVGEMTQLFANTDLTRPPIQVPVTMHENGDTISFNFITLHLKAGTTSDDLGQRRHACELLHDYIGGIIEDGGEDHWVIAGDWNDELDDSDNYNAFPVFLDDPQNWVWLDEWMVGHSNWASHPLSGRLIDHILVTDEFYTDIFQNHGSCETIQLQNEWGSYHTYISDHVPTAAYIDAPDHAIDTETTVELPAAMELSIWPTPFNSQLSVRFETPAGQGATVNVYNALGKLVLEKQVNGGTGSFSWSPEGMSSGMYFVQLQSGAETVVQRTLFLP